MAVAMKKVPENAVPFIIEIEQKKSFDQLFLDQGIDEE